MRRKIPSSGSMMAFEAAARHGSFARAADELALTEGAISRQIAKLEAFLGTRLFNRLNNRVHLTPHGARYAVQVREVLDRLDRDSQYLQGQSAQSASLDIAVTPTFASRWLIPRLACFQKMYSGITLHLSERTEPFVLAGSGFDAAVHFEHPAWAGMRTYRLFQEVLIPVCHPSLLKQTDPVNTLNELPLIHRRQNPDAWEKYAEETGLVIHNPAVGARYDLHSMSIAAALAGLGVALVPRIYVEQEIQQGLLTAPWPEGKTVAKNFCLVLPEVTNPNEAALISFQQWLLEEAHEQR